MAACTLAEVARLAGVSLSTASRVLNGSARTPSADIAKRVRTVADSLGYVPNAQAQSLAKSTSGLIGLIVHDIADPYFSQIARGVQHAAGERQKFVLLATTDGTPAVERAAVAAFASHRADTIVLAGSRCNRPQDTLENARLAVELDRYCRNGGRVGVVGHVAIGAKASFGYHTVPLPNEELAAELAYQLATSRAREFVIIAGPDGLLTSDDRVRGFQHGLAAAGTQTALVMRARFDRNGGHDAGQGLSHHIKSKTVRKPAPLCVLAANDVMAIGAAAALESEGFRIPDDVAIAGFDGIELLRDFQPKLSTVRLPLELIGHLAAFGDGGGAPSIEGEVILAQTT